MAKLCVYFYLSAIIFQAVRALAITDDLDVQVLREMYRSLNTPSQLKKWRLETGDPCGESWTGVSCSGSSVIHLELQGLELSGHLGLGLSNLKNLKQLDLSSNNIQGEIPGGLPLNLTHLNLARNRFSESVPSSVALMKHLRHLNLSHNTLSGSLGDIFSGLENLREMDLSFNSFKGDLPISFRSLTNLTRLFLQSNEFTGSVIFLADLPLSDLNIEDNHFSGVIPEKFQAIRNLWIGGNRFDKAANYPPWNFPLDVLPNNTNVTSPPAEDLSAIENHPSPGIRGHKTKKRNTVGIAFLVSGGIVVSVCAAIFFVVRSRQTGQKIFKSLMCDEGSMGSPQGYAIGDHSANLENSPNVSSLNSPALISPSRLPPVRTKLLKVSKRKSFSTDKMPISAKFYTVAELQSATNSFSEENLLGEGSLGSVYRAEFLDGVISAVKTINSVPLSIMEEEQFLDVVRTVSRLMHPNIVRLHGYCMQHGQYLLVYEYIRNLSLDDALHCAAYKPLSWGLRLQIALGIAQALNYMHSFVPPSAHSNLKASNILLDEELFPRLCDCGLVVLRALTSNSVKAKAAEMAIADGGYTAPEHVQPGIGNIKADVYAYGVLLLELLTGRRPFDSSKPKAEQSLVEWASSRLHDRESLEEMVDPTITRTISSKCLSRFADIVSLCIQCEKEFRPSMSEIVDSLVCLLQKSDPAHRIEGDPMERSFRSTNSRFFGSPTLSYYSV